MRRVKEWLRRRRVRKLAERILANQQIIGWRDSRESIAADTIQMAEGTVIEVYNDSCGRKRPFSEWRFRVRIDDEYATKLNIQSWNIDSCHNVDRAKFKKSTAPKEGDRVRLKCRITKDSPRWNMFHQPIIDEIIAQAEIGKEAQNELRHNILRGS